MQNVPMIAAKVQVDERPRCWRCKRLLAEFAARPWSIKCKRCQAQNNSGG